MINNYTHLTSVYDTVINKKDMIHKELFDNAIKEYVKYDENKEKLMIQSENELNIKYIIIDLNDNEDYLDSSNAILLSKFRPLKRIKIDLEPYWNKNYVKIYKEILNNENLLIDEINLRESEFESVDFVKGKIYYKNKFTNKIFGISFDKYHKQLQFEQLKNI